MYSGFILPFAIRYTKVTVLSSANLQKRLQAKRIDANLWSEHVYQNIKKGFSEQAFGYSISEQRSKRWSILASIFDMYGIVKKVSPSQLPEPLIAFKNPNNLYAVLGDGEVKWEEIISDLGANNQRFSYLHR